MKPTIRDVARVAGVSVATASMALNNRDGVGENTRDKVRRVAVELNYIPDYMARGLVMGDSNCIGLMVPEIQNPFYSAVVDNLSRLVEEKGFTMLLGISNSNPQQEKRYIEMFLARRVVGVIVVPMLLNKPDVSYLHMLRQAEVPLVFLTEIYADAGEPVVMCDFEQGQYEITRMLLEKGLRDLLYVTVDMDTAFVNRRLAGFRRALEEYGLPLNPKRILRLKMPSYDDAYHVAEPINETLPEAIVCINDIMAIALLKKLGEKGIRVPRDLYAVGFDDIQVASLVTPTLTTVRQPVKEMCEKAFEILQALIEKKPNEEEVVPVQETLFQPQLVIRDSAR